MTVPDRLTRWIDCEKSGSREMWDYDPRPDIERLLLAFRYLHDSALLVVNGCDTGHMELGLEAAEREVRKA